MKKILLTVSDLGLGAVWLLLMMVTGLGCGLSGNSECSGFGVYTISQFLFGLSILFFIAGIVFAFFSKRHLETFLRINTFYLIGNIVLLAGVISILVFNK